MANYRLRWSRTNNLKLKVSARIPAQLVGGDGIEVTRSNATYTIDLDYSDLTTVLSIDSAFEATTYIALWESTQDTWSKITATSLKDEIGFPSSSTDNAIARYDGTTGDLQDSGVLIDDSNNVVPASNDGGALGTTALKWSDGFWASGAVLNFNSGNMTITHSAGVLTVAGGVWVVPNAGLQVGASVPFSDAAGTLTLQNVDALDATTESTIEAAIDTLANLTSIQGFTVTLTGNLIRSGAHSLTLTTTGATSLTLPTSGTVATTSNKLSDFAATTSLELKGNISDETGSGALVFATSPTLVTPLLGTPTSGTLTNCTGLPVSSGISGLGANVATFLATPSSANLASALTDETGSGANVFATSPTLVTPILGTPTSGTLTNCTGLPISSGVSGLGANVATFLATPSSANLASALTDETGSGAAVFGTSPSITTPTFPNYVQLTEISSPSSPAADNLRVFAKDVSGTTHLFTRDSAGTETDLNAGAAGVSAATQAEMEAASSTTVYASPGRTQYHPGVCKQWALWAADGTITTSHNTTSTAKDSTGIYTVTIATDMSSSSYVVVCGDQTGGTFANTNTYAAGSYKVEIRNTVNNNVDAISCSAAFGDQ